MSAAITVLSIVHFVIAFLLIAFVLLQDGKSGGMVGMGGSSQSIFGASGGKNILITITRTLAFLFMASCITIGYLLNHTRQSVFENVAPAPVTAPAQPEQKAAEPAPAPAPQPENKK